MAKETPEETIARLEKEKKQALELLEKANGKLTAQERAQKAGVQVINPKGKKEPYAVLSPKFIIAGDESKTIHNVEDLEKDSELVEQLFQSKGQRVCIPMKQFEAEKALAVARKESRKKAAAKATETEEESE